ncbi:hypothetical protein [Micromonospora foliorum]|uniref:hypothetical protein n=1 Tax=Micromonospora foliorum TaxID=2911210 RepID=UPI001EE7CEE0|nr:hypothetical protein [Micromonospora foliorum]MCG5435237.1 hypothetical protein [Micromonospora foliorum]
MQIAQSSPGKSSRAAFGCGLAAGAGLHTLLIVVVGLIPRGSDDLAMWSFSFLFASAIPVSVVALVGLLLAPNCSSVGWAGRGAVVGVVTSPLLWLLGVSLLWGS